MKYILLILSLCCSLNSYAWFNAGCKPVTIDDLCIAFCYINANTAVTKLHDGVCTTQNEQDLTPQR